MLRAAVRVADLAVLVMQVLVGAVQAASVVQAVAELLEASTHAALVVRGQGRQALRLRNAVVMGGGGEAVRWTGFM